MEAAGARLSIDVPLSLLDISDDVDACSICMEQDDKELVTLACKHRFHKACLQAQVAAQSPTIRLTFGYLRCALCRMFMNRDVIEGLHAHFDLCDQVHAVCRKRALEDCAIEGLISQPSDKAYEVVMEEMAAYRCARCQAVYCGGRVECAANVDVDPTSLLCHDCAWRDAKSTHKCEVHGARKAVFKCDCCCAIATYDCSGNHYCDSCHQSVNDGVTIRPNCRGRVQDCCPLSLLHPPNQPRNHSVRKKGFVVGCIACLGIDGHCEMAVSNETAGAF